MLESNTTAEVDNTGNRENAINTTCRINGHGFRPGNIYVNPTAQHEISIVDHTGRIADQWYLDDSLDILMHDEDTHQPDINYNDELASQQVVGDKVYSIYMVHIVECVYSNVYSIYGVVVLTVYM